MTTGGTVVATYTYNALNQRIGVKDSGTQTWTVYDGTSPDANPYADFNGSGSLTERYLFGPGVVNGAVMSVILARTSSGGTTAWYLTDNLGSVRDIVDTSGNELDHIVYDAFGNIVTETNAANGDRFKFAGMQYDATTGQYYDHARFYSPVEGRFLGLDPRQFAGLELNLYSYVGNAPRDATDPDGTSPESGTAYPWEWKYILPLAQLKQNQQLLLTNRASLSIATQNLSKNSFLINRVGQMMELDVQSWVQRLRDQVQINKKQISTIDLNLQRIQQNMDQIMHDWFVEGFGWQFFYYQNEQNMIRI